MDMKLEVVVFSVCDVSKAKGFYQVLGWRLDADFAAGEDFRVVQLTPPGSHCSVIIGTGITSARLSAGHAPGRGRYRRGPDRAGWPRCRDERSVPRRRRAGARTRPGPGPPRLFASFSDPDGNGWLLQEITTRLPGR
jgi:catechol 2,3-dioxygenase-like lactoylglutathione lyase family enzyme